MAKTITARRLLKYPMIQLSKLPFVPTKCLGSPPLCHCASTASRPRSPFVILNLKTSATEQDIKNAFRKLAKKYHPDLNPNLSPAVSQSKMTEIIQAYSQLMDDDFLGAKFGDGRVALACEMFTLEELKMDRIHNVYSIRVLFHNENEEVDGNSTDEDAYSTSRISGSGASEDSDVNDVSTQTITQIVAHPEDSVSDLKRFVQEKNEESWGLTERRMDRDQIRTGWELICQDRRAELSESSRADSNLTRIKLNGEEGQKEEQEQLVMSYHLFLHSYRIRHGDLIHAVVRRYDT